MDNFNSLLDEADKLHATLKEITERIQKLEVILERVNYSREIDVFVHSEGQKKYWICWKQCFKRFRLVGEIEQYDYAENCDPVSVICKPLVEFKIEDRIIFSRHIMDFVEEFEEIIKKDREKFQQMKGE